MLRQRKNMLDSMIYEIENDDVASSDAGEVKPPEIKPPKKKKKTKKRKKPVRDNSRPLVPVQTLQFQSNPPKTNNVNVLSISTDNEYIVLSDDDHTDNVVGQSVEPEIKPIECSTTDTNLGVQKQPSKVPLISVHFRDVNVARMCKSRIKFFIQNLLSQSRTSECISGDDTDLELDIFPEEHTKCVDIPNPMDIPDDGDKMFVIDTNPVDGGDTDVPAYSNKFGVLKDGVSEETSKPKRRVQLCCSCDGVHNLKDCTLKKDYNRINQKRKALMKVGRYHTEDEQRFGHLVPGRISRKLRTALNLRKNQLPLHIYRMRLLGYPPGWIEAARIEHSGMVLFDSLGNQIAEPEDEDGEIFEAGSKDKFDIKKIYDFPGFNVPASSRYTEECDTYGCPPMMEHQSKLTMLQEMAPNAMQAYKRKKLKLMDTGNQDDDIDPRNEADNEADMDIDSDAGDADAEFPVQPPLPDDPPPPPDDLPPPPPPDDSPAIEALENGTSDRELSPPLSDLEKRKKLLLAELAEKEDCLPDSPDDNEDKLQKAEQSDSSSSVDASSSKGDSLKSTPLMGKVKSSDYGTPLIDASSPFAKLPSGDKFSKNICDVINFENLPDSTGKYSQMTGLIKKVRTVITRIQSDS